MTKPAPVLLGALLIAACSSGGTGSGGGGPEAPPRWLEGGTGVSLRVAGERSVAESTVAVAPDLAWRVLPEVYESLGLGGRVLDGARRSFGNREVTARTLAGSRTDSFFRCANEGAGPSSVNRFRITFSITTTVTSGDGSARLSTDVEATGRPWEGTSSGAVICTSRGVLESAIERGVLERAGAVEAEPPRAQAPPPLRVQIAITPQSACDPRNSTGTCAPQR